MPERDKEYWDKIKTAARTLDGRSRNLFHIVRAQHTQGEDCLFPSTGVYNYGLTAEAAEEILQRLIIRLLLV